jgi:Arc/MetJ family transcription regulator
MKQRTNIEIDSELMKSALKALGGKATKRQVVEEGLKLLVRIKGQAKIRTYRGKLKWTGNLHKSRLD